MEQKHKKQQQHIFPAQIRKYHHEFYRPENLHVIITGMVGAEQVFEALEPIEQKIISKVGKVKNKYISGDRTT